MKLLARLSTFAALFVAASFIVLPYAEAGSIDVSFETLVITDKSRTAMASLSIDGEDSNLFQMTSLTLPGMRNGGEEVEETTVYTKTEATTRTVTGGSEVVWKGSISDTGRFGFATVIQHTDGSVSGVFSTETSTFTLSKMPDGTMQLKETFWVDALETDEIDDSDIPSFDIVGRSEEYVDSAMVVDIPKSDSSKTSSGNGVKVSGGANRMLRDGKRDLSDFINIDVLVLITNRALCESAGLTFGCELTDESRAPIEGMMKVVEEQTNEAMQGVNVRTSVTFVNFIYISSDFDGRPGVDTLQILRASQNVAEWRSQAGADLVAMVSGDDPNRRVGGIAYIGGPESVTSFNAIRYYTMSHELMHCIGAYHNRKNSKTQHSYGHGLQVPGELRTLMAYQCPDSPCPRIPYLSADGYTYNGFSIGDSSNDNARLVREKSAKIAAYRDLPTDSPTASPTSAPSEFPTASPSQPPTGSPVDSPTGSPVDSPTGAPVVVADLLRFEVRDAATYALVEKLDGGEVLDLDELNVSSFNILARPQSSSGVINSVVFSYNGVLMSVRNITNLLWMCDEACNLGAGEVTISATPFSGPNGTGMAGETQTVTFQVVAQ